MNTPIQTSFYQTAFSTPSLIEKFLFRNSGAPPEILPAFVKVRTAY